MNFLDIFTLKELIIMASVLGSLLMIIFIICLTETINKIKNRNKEIIVEETNINDLEIKETNIVLEKEESNNLNSLEVNPIKENKEFKQLEEIKIENNQVAEELFEEIEPIVLEEPVIVKLETDDIKMSVQEKAKLELNKLEEELEHAPTLEDTITNLEAIEEESAIISYQELLENTGELTVVMEDDGNEPITINELFNLFNGEKNKDLIVNESLAALPIDEAYKGDFVSTPLVSPITGFENENLVDIQIENTANLEKLDKEIRKTNHFLNILNELKKNLD